MNTTAIALIVRSTFYSLIGHAASRTAGHAASHVSSRSGSGSGFLNEAEHYMVRGGAWRIGSRVISMLPAGVVIALAVALAVGVIVAYIRRHSTR